MPALAHRQTRHAGTPLQNNTEELFALLHFLAPDYFNDEAEFLRRFGQLSEAKQVEDLKEAIKPFLLRRMKQDVEAAIPPKEETIIDIELTSTQKQYYRAIYERNTDFLLRGTTRGNSTNLMNVMMELRKVCNHPYLVNGVEEATTASFTEPKQFAEHFVAASGKLVLLSKLLPRLRAGGHRVLIFSQMVRLLDLLEDFIRLLQYKYERLDGNVRGNDRQVCV